MSHTKVPVESFVSLSASGLQLLSSPNEGGAHHTARHTNANAIAMSSSPSSSLFSKIFDYAKDIVMEWRGEVERGEGGR